MDRLHGPERLQVEKNLKNRVYETLKNYVMHPNVLPGTRLYEEKLAMEIGVSRTPVKMALERLEHDGLVTTIPNKGAFKVRLSWQEVIEVIRIRETVECLALQMLKDVSGNREMVSSLRKLIPDPGSFAQLDLIDLYPSLDHQFHKALIELEGSRIFVKAIESVHNLNQLLGFVIIGNMEKVKESIEGHQKIVDALEANDLARAIRCLRENYESAVKDLKGKRLTMPGLFT